MTFDKDQAGERPKTSEQLNVDAAGPAGEGADHADISSFVSQGLQMAQPDYTKE